MPDDLSEIRRVLVEACGLMAEAMRRLDAVVVQLPASEPGCEPRLPCEKCAELGKCKEPCKKLEKLLPAAGHGRGRKENLLGCDEELIAGIDRPRLSEIFEKRYLPCRHIFTVKQWRVVELFYNQSLTETEIGQKLGTRRNSVNELHQRAKEKMEDYWGKFGKQLRE